MNLKGSDKYSEVQSEQPSQIDKYYSQNSFQLTWLIILKKDLHFWQRHFYLYRPLVDHSNLTIYL